jgi:hypothetical protein
MTKNINALPLQNIQKNGLTLLPNKNSPSGNGADKHPKFVQKNYFDFDADFPEFSNSWKNKPDNHLNTWSKEDDAKLRAANAKELSVDSLAIMFARTKRAIRFRLNHLELDENKPYLLVRGDCDEEDDGDDEGYLLGR